MELELELSFVPCVEHFPWKPWCANSQIKIKNIPIAIETKKKMEKKRNKFTKNTTLRSSYKHQENKRN